MTWQLLGVLSKLAWFYRDQVLVVDCGQFEPQFPYLEMGNNNNYILL